MNGCFIAYSLTYTLMFIGILLYCSFSSAPIIVNCIKFPSLKSFEEFGSYVSKAKSTLILEAIENWSFEIASMLSGYLIVN